MNLVKSLSKGSTWLKILEDLTYVCPTLITVLYYYFTELEQSISYSSKASFGLALSLLFLFMILKRVAKHKIEEIRQAKVQTETDYKNGVGDPEKCASNLYGYSTKLDTAMRFQIMVVLLCASLAIYILEQASIGLSTLIVIALVSVLAGTGIHIGQLKLLEKEMKDESNEEE